MFKVVGKENFSILLIQNPLKFLLQGKKGIVFTVTKMS